MFIYLPSTINFTAVNPSVQFFDWTSGARQNNITLSYNFAANVTTYVENATYGINNTGGETKTVYNWIDSISDTAYLTNITIEIRTQDGVTLMATIQWTGGDLPTTPVSWDAEAVPQNYMLRIWCTGATSVDDIIIKLGLRTDET